MRVVGGSQPRRARAWRGREALLRVLHFKRRSLARDSLRDSPRDKAPRAPDFLRVCVEHDHVIRYERDPERERGEH